jgi:hypothetical protein
MAATRNPTPRPGDEIKVDGEILLTIWSAAPRPRRWWAVDENGAAALVELRGGEWISDPRPMAHYRPGMRVVSKSGGHFGYGTTGTVVESWYRGRTERTAKIMIRFDASRSRGEYVDTVEARHVSLAE